jgi:predicted AlkP superfamily phosphohydrolase/phosphomutase
MQAMDSFIEELAADLKRDGLRAGRAVVLGIDGVPHSLLQRLMAAGRMPNMAKLAAAGTLRRMESTLPCVSSVAWTCFRTGRNPGQIGLTGFTDRRPRTYKTYFPQSTALPLPTMEEYAANMGLKVMVMGMPVNYPPVKVKNGVSIGCFLSPTLEKAVYPVEILDTLKRLDYRIDVNTSLAAEPERFIQDVFAVTERYRDTLFHFWEKEKWDLMMIHFMTTDRMHHFMWDQSDEAAPYHKDFLELYSRIDGIIGEVAGKIDDDTLLMLLSDHGFCGIKREVNLNVWLQQEGFLRFQSSAPKSLEEIDGRSKAYSLIPGRIFINLKGREPRGSVAPGREAESVCEQIAERLSQLRDPQTGEPVIERVENWRRFYGANVCGVAPDLVALGHYGYDLKDQITGRELFRPSKLKGMHTYDDAFLFVNRPLAIPDGIKIFEASAIVGEQCRCRHPLE